MGSHKNDTVFRGRRGKGEGVRGCRVRRLWARERRGSRSISLKAGAPAAQGNLNHPSLKTLNKCCLKGISWLFRTFLIVKKFLGKIMINVLKKRSHRTVVDNVI